MRYAPRRSSPWAGAASTSLVLAALSLTASGCREARRDEMSAEESAHAVEALTTWFECEECQSGELAAVANYGQPVVPSLVAVVNGGLSPATRENLRRELEVRYDELAARRQTTPNARLGSSKEQFTALYLSNRDAQYRARAAQALAAIGGKQARGALEAALRGPQRDDVQEVIRRSLSAMK
jgi:hypothetical protein